MMKQPRAATAARASPAMKVAPTRATASASARASIFMSSHRRLMPAVGGRNPRVAFPRSPGAGLIFVDGRAGLQHGIHDPPRLFDVVLPREQRSVAVHGVSQHALVGVHLVGAWEP